MRELQTKDLIRLIPLSIDFRKKLLVEYDTYEAGKKFEITRVMWEAFDELYEAIKAAKTDKLTKEVADGTRHISGDISLTIDQEVWEEIEKRLQKDPADDQSLSKVREKLQHLITET
ncbi:TPA: hypothetical protein HA253_06385 [Candidatus Woesearchaeota archaeon]|nr:hypothetical protein [Candidatus Woesearchaeota archaeon]